MRAEIQALIIKELQAAEGLDFRKCIKARGKWRLAHSSPAEEHAGFVQSPWRSQIFPSP